MSIRSVDELGSHLIEELKWRSAELDTWEGLASSCRHHQRTGVLRAGVALLYAHWEGYIKEAARAYLEYISLQGLRVGDLRDELAAVALRTMLGSGEQSKRSSDHTSIVSALRTELQRKAHISHERSMIRTRSNLKFDVFEDIMHSIGCDSSRHELQRAMINNRLVKSRNDIAHGRRLVIEVEDWIDMRTRVGAILKDVRDQIRVAAETQAYKRADPEIF
ncbi:MAE_28990/MAE_18760 family HEPN-like nuclease [Nonomuraea sp. SBT364]|uniref:MAE_28990/MAE_18760 family HEPN-like nuclease n=1 Tax=Nonomuraea sp. SBT364 TaxID=1580530 RepID=UPI003FA5FAAA